MYIYKHMYAGKKLLLLEVHVQYIKKKHPLHDFMGILKVNQYARMHLHVHVLTIR